MTQLIDLNALELDRDGVQILHRVVGPNEIASWIGQLEAAFTADLGAIKNRRGAVYAARNILDVLPHDCAIWNREPISKLLEENLGMEYGLVRGLYFDKHPKRTWSLPWHKDMTIAVKDNSHLSSQFTKPTRKSGVPHVEAPESVLQDMLTLRVHLDDVTEENGPLEVVLGSHRDGKQTSSTHQTAKIIACAGDVLAMRPLVSHASGSSTPGTAKHRRILHFEFAGQRQLADGFEWYTWK